MEEKKIVKIEEKNIPYVAYESSQVRLERMNRRMWILCLVLILALLGTNAGWLYYENQFVDEVSVEQDAEWDDNSQVILNATGGVNINGESTSKSN